jgi:hypothetical protein
LANCLSSPIVRRPIKSNLWWASTNERHSYYPRCDDTSTEQTRIRTESWPRKGVLTSTEDYLDYFILFYFILIFSISKYQQHLFDCCIQLCYNSCYKLYTYGMCFVQPFLRNLGSMGKVN